jgi:hypothetical protein
MDPMTTAEAAYEESVMKADDARVEQHWREAESAAAFCVDDARGLRVDDCGAVEYVLSGVRDETNTDFDYQTLRAFAADYGLPALLRVIAKSLEGGQ